MANIRIQRVPKGLAEVMGAFGPENPSQVGDVVSGTLSLEQFYARQQLQSFSFTGALAEGGQLSFGPTSWGFLVAAEMRIASTATMTAYAGALFFSQQPAGSPLIALAHGNWNDGGLGAGRTFTVCEFVPSIPMLMAPGNRLTCELDALGVDANATVSLQILFGALG